MRRQGIVWLPVFEEPCGRGGREETKTDENNYGNQNSHCERNHTAPLVLAVLCPAANAGQHRNDQSNLNSQEHITLIASVLNTPKGADE